jgi:ParB family chromosome partitioning protein
MPSKMATLKQTIGANSDESMGATKLKAKKGEKATPLPSPPASPKADMLRGLSKPVDAAIIPIRLIEPDADQPRKEFDPEALEQLAESLRTRGQLQPIRVRWDEPRATWIVVSGERRYRAAKLAGLANLSCVMAGGSAGESGLLVDQIVENCQRSDLKPIEQAEAFARLRDDHGMMAVDIAKLVGLSKASVTRSLALLDLPEDIQGLVEAGSLTASTAYELSKVEGEGRQSALAEKVVNEGLNRSQAVDEIRRNAQPKKVEKSVTSPPGWDLKVGSVIRTNYNTGPYSIEKFHEVKGGYCGHQLWSMTCLDLDPKTLLPKVPVRHSHLNDYWKDGNTYRRRNTKDALILSTKPPEFFGNGARPEPPELHGETRRAVVTDWRDLPIAEAGLPGYVLGKLEKTDIKHAGEAWMELEHGYLRTVHGWSMEDCKSLEIWLLRLREEHGDPGKLAVKAPPVIPIEPKDEEPIGLKWIRTPFAQTVETLLASKNGLQAIVQAYEERTLDEVRDLLIDALDEVDRILFNKKEEDS